MTRFLFEKSNEFVEMYATKKVESKELNEFMENCFEN